MSRLQTGALPLDRERFDLAAEARETARRCASPTKGIARGGEIRVRSAPGRGSCFEIDLPL